VSTIGDPRFVARAGWALACAHARYWTSVAPLARLQLRRWETRAAEIPDPFLQHLALGKLANERFNVEVAAMIATTAPPRHRKQTIEAIVALQVMYDYLDALTEQPTAHPIRDGLQYSKAFTDAVTISAHPAAEYYAYHTGMGDGRYLADLAKTVRAAIRTLPAGGAVAETIPVAAARCAEAQVRIHAAPHVGMGEIERWVKDQAIGTELGWREWLFGAMGSVVAIHALVALAADQHATRDQARELDDAYLALCVLTTALDHLVDYEHDALTGGHSYVDLYRNRDEFAERIAVVVRQVIERVRVIPDGPHHLMILSGVVAYYTSQPSAMGEFARPATQHVRDQLRPLITPTLATMQAWRLAKRLGSRSTICARFQVRARNGRVCAGNGAVLKRELSLEREAMIRTDRGQDQPTRDVADSPPMH
jgi:tetraprenyl-beta-curcumene synthase